VAALPVSDHNQPLYYAHSALKEQPQWQRLSVHLEATATRAAAFLDAVGLADFGRAAGLLHDLGKYTADFQARLEGASRQVDHATPGAAVAIERYGSQLGKLLAFCIAGHHAGLANGVNGRQGSALVDRLGGPVASPDPTWERGGCTPGFPGSATARTAQGHARILRGVPRADGVLGARRRGLPGYRGVLRGTGRLPRDPRAASPPRGPSATARCASQPPHANTPRSAVNELRREVHAHVRAKAAQAPGVLTLTVPTGGGKTLTSLAFALQHAVQLGLERVIYVIPYTSVIEQTARVFRCALRDDDGDRADFVIEHHSTFDDDRISGRESRNKLRLAMENWDAPIIVTTAVQFFESMFANRPSRCRKLHNLANSVVILDEAQTLPLKYLRPCVVALDELARNWRASIVLCTAAQPALGASDGFAGGFENMRELAPAPRSLYGRLKRTRMRHVGTLDDAQLAARIRGSPQGLCIVN